MELQSFEEDRTSDKAARYSFLLLKYTLLRISLNIEKKILIKITYYEESLSFHSICFPRKHKITWHQNSSSA